jgi:fermentation-respiration switch protein FrsA (DUF1100 family)
MRKFSLVVFLWLAALSSGCSSLLYYPAKEPFTDPTRFQHKPENIYFKTEDGLTLHGWYFKSDKRPAKATLLLFHGNGQNLTTHFYSAYWALERGFDYMIFDYRGYGESEGKPLPQGTVKDGKAALQWISSHKDPASKLVIFGQSLGGAVALRVACEAAKPAPFDEVVVDSTFVSYRKAAQKIMSHSWPLWPFQWFGWLVMNDTYAPKNCMAEISPRPLLVVHGTSDPVVDFSLGEKVYQLASAPKEFWIVEGGRHIDFLFRNNMRYQAKLADWILNGPKSPEAVETLKAPVSDSSP